MRYYRGPLLGHLCKELFGVNNKETRDRLHKALKTRFGIKSTSTLTGDEIRAYTRDIRTVMSTEWGILSPLSGERDNIDEMSMKAFLELTLTWKDHRQDQ